MDKHIVIIGAGASGIAAATKLLDNGFENITVLEAEPRIGGRVNTVAYGSGVVDLGAQWYVSILIKLSTSIQYSKIGVMVKRTTWFGKWLRTWTY